MKLRIQSMALAGGIVWGVLLFLTTLAGVYFQYGLAFLNVIASIYPGYTVSLVGSVVGLLYGFFDVFLGVYILAWVYRHIITR